MLSETGASTSSAEQSRNDDVDIKAIKLIGEGKRHLLVGDPPTAVTTLQEACEILAAKYGEVSDQCGDSYYNYGNALLELGRMETGVLGNALDGVPSGSATDTDDEKEAEKVEGDERKKVVEQVKEALETNYQECKKKDGTTPEANGHTPQANGDTTKADGEAPKVNGEAPKVNGEAPKADGDAAHVNGEGGEAAKMEVDAEKDKEETKKDEKAGKDVKEGETQKDDGKDATKETKDACAGTTDMGEAAEEDEESETEDTGNETGDEKKEENADDVPNFQLAWEMLELSRVIYSRKTDKEGQLKVAQVHFKLGELGLETEQYAQSLEDFGKCLEIQKKHLEPSSRLIAGSHYNLGLAFLFDAKLDKALEHFTEAKKTIEDRIAILDKDVAEQETKKADGYEDKVKTMKQEVTELKELVPDILAKIEDAKESKAQLPAGETSTGFGDAGTAAAAPTQTVQVKRKSDTGAASDITHLVKRKRTEEPESTAASDKTDTKKPKQDGAGDAQVNGTAETKGDTKEGAAMETAS